MHYRLYKPEDFEALYAIEEACFVPPFTFGRRYMRWLVSAPNAATWIAEDLQAMAGFAIVEWTPATNSIGAYIQTIEVAPGYRGQGVGRMLLQCVESSAREAIAQVLWLHVEDANTTAIRLYESSGFSPAGNAEDYYAPGRHALIYRKEMQD